MKNHAMLVERVLEQHGSKFVPSDDYGKTAIYLKVPIVVPVGVMVGVKEGNVIRTGWSKVKLPPKHIPDEILVQMRHECQSKYRKALENSDAFNMDRGIAEACRRILMGIPSIAPKGKGFARKYDTFRLRCKKYFKGARIQ